MTRPDSRRCPDRGGDQDRGITQILSGALGRRWSERLNLRTRYARSRPDGHYFLWCWVATLGCVPGAAGGAVWFPERPGWSVGRPPHKAANRPPTCWSIRGAMPSALGGTARGPGGRWRKYSGGVPPRWAGLGVDSSTRGDTVLLEPSVGRQNGSTTYSNRLTTLRPLRGRKRDDAPAGPAGSARGIVVF